MKTREKWLILVISAGKGNTLTPVQLQKCVFLLGQQQAGQVGADYYDFVPYDYGPFDIDVYRDAEDCERRGLVSIQLNKTGRWKEYALTITGEQVAEKLRSDSDSQIVQYIDDLVKWAMGLSFQELVREVYKMYPKFKGKSVFQDWLT